ncbi:unnamed protein product [Prorocentrum cordatum]|uniref:Uncharacterized protein n=1 Tax=Prorocentrum cordatum TaxID=2364126 RepID=A0ABN9TYC9_9DINO|nr:unnamed protein product [Polarella glacialis]
MKAKSSTESWEEGLDFAAERASILKKVEEWREQVRRFRRHESALQGVIDRKGVEREKAQRDWRGVRDKIRQFLANRGLPDPVAMMSANWLREMGVKSADVSIKMEYAKIPELPCDQALTANTFLEPFMITKPQEAGAGPKGPAHEVFGKIFKDRAEEVGSKVPEIRDYMKKKSVDSSWGTIAFEPTLAFGAPAEGGASLDPVGGLRMAVFCRNTGAWQCNSTVYPWKEAPVFIQQFVGASIVFMCGPSFVKEHVDLNGHVEGSDSAALYKVKSCVLQAGSVLFAPMGFAPLIVPIPPNVDWGSAKPSIKEPKQGTEQKHCGAFGISLFLSPAVRSLVPPDVRLSVATAWGVAKGHGQLPKSIRENEKVNAWFDECGKPEEDEDAHDRD